MWLVTRLFAMSSQTQTTGTGETRAQTKLHTTQIGSGSGDTEKIVFLHGLFGRGKNFTSIAKGLEPECTSLLVDLPNHGQSPWTEEFDYIEMADAVAEELVAFGAEESPVGVVGHSMGGKVAMMLALRHPELVDRLVVEDISPVSSEDSKRDAGSGFSHLLNTLRALDLSTVGSRSEADETLAADIPDDRVRGFLLQNLRPGDDGYYWEPNLDLLCRSLSRIGEFPDTDGKTYDRLVLWVAGEKSDYIRPEHTPAMRELFPRMLKVTIKGAGHWIHSEKPQEFLAALRRFFIP